MTTATTFFRQGFALGDRFTVQVPFNRVLIKSGEETITSIKIEPKAMEVLQLLAAADGAVVHKNKMVAAIWQEYGGGEDALVQAISKLRKVFNDNAKNPQVIETIPKKGYRLLLPVGQILNGNKATAKKTVNTQQPSVQAKGFIRFIERLTEPRFFLAFLVFSGVVAGILGILYQIVFWLAVM